MRIERIYWNSLPLTLLLLVFCTLQALAQDSITWIHDLEDAKARAAKEHKYILLDVFAEWCGPCQQMERTTWKDAKVVARMNKDFVPLKIDSDKNAAVASQYGIESLPTVLLLTAQGTPFAQRVGYLGPDSLLEFLDESSKLEAQMGNLKKSIEAKPDDLDSVLELAKLQLLFDKAGESIQLLNNYRERMNQDTPQDTRAKFAYQIGLAQLVEEDYEKGLSSLEPFLDTYKDHELAPIATQMYGIGTVEFARNKVESGHEDEARKMLAQLGGHDDQPYLQELAKSSIAMLDAIKEKQEDLAETQPSQAPE